MILYGYPLPLGQRNTLCPGAGGKARLFSPSPCSRGVASETRGCGGLVPRKAFSFGNLSQSQANRQSWAKPGRIAGELGKAGRIAGELGEAPPGFSNLCSGRGRMSVKNRKGGFFRLYDSLWIPLAAPPKEHTLPQSRW